MKLNLEIVGEGEKVCFLHGFGFNYLCFEPLVSALSNRYQCYLVDLPGFGLSEFQPYTMDILIDALHSILPKKVSFVGWSLGGNVALAYAQKYSSNTKALLLTGTNPLFVTDLSWPSMKECEFSHFYNLCKTNLKQALKNFLQLQFPSGKISKKTYLLLKKIMSTNELTTTAALNALMVLKNSDLRQAYEHSEVPILAVFGREDQLVPCQISECRMFAEQNQAYVFELSGHIPFLTERARFITLMDDFLC